MNAHTYPYSQRNKMKQKSFHCMYILCYKILIIPEILYSPQFSIFLSLPFDPHNNCMKYVKEKRDAEKS